MPLFIFAFAEELQKPFLPIFVRQLHAARPWLSESVIISLPIVVWLMVVGLSAPYCGRWTHRWGSRNIFLWGLIPSLMGLLGCSMADAVPEVIFWRGAAGLGYAMVSIACHDYLLGSHVEGHRNANIVTFVGIVIGATMSGTAIGGILAARIGYRITFFIGAGLVVLSGIAAYRMLSREAGRGSAARQGKRDGVNGIRLLLRNRRFIVFLACIAIPTNILMAAYLWYLVPLYLFDLGATTGEIGRIIMIYYLLIYGIGMMMSNRVDTMRSLTMLVGLGAMLSGLGLIAFHQWHHLWAVVLSVSILGLSHGLIKAPQIALSLEICRTEVAVSGHNIVLGAFRLLERFGSIAGLIAGAVVIDLFGYQNTIGLAGIAVCSASLLFILFFYVTRTRTPAVVDPARSKREVRM
jgi:MFS family permease